MDRWLHGSFNLVVDEVDYSFPDRNQFDSAFTSSTDKVVSGFYRYQHRTVSFGHANFGLAWRASASVLVPDPDALARRILGDKSIGNEVSRNDLFVDTLNLAYALTVRNSLAVSDCRARPSFAALSAHDAMGVVKRRGWSFTPLAITSFFSPWLTLPASILHFLLFSDRLHTSVYRPIRTTAHKAWSYCLEQSAAALILTGETRGRVRRLFVDGDLKHVWVHKVGPVLVKPHYWAHTVLELLRSLYKRSGRVTPPVDPEQLPLFSRAVTLALDRAYPNGIDWELPLDMRTIIEAAAWPSSKKRAYLQALDAFEITGAPHTASAYSAFVKA